MRFVYNVLFTFAFILSTPFYFLKMWRRGNWREGFGQRFGRYNTRIKQAITNRHLLWIHAVSVGEVNVCTQLIRTLEPRVPNIKIVVSTTTSTGMAELQRKLPRHIEKIYYPIDHRRCVARAIGTIHPEAIILVEAEIWPNFLWRARDLNIPSFLVNARMSEGSYAGYKRFGFLFRPIFGGFTGVGAQNEMDAARLRDLGCRPEAIEVVGSLKFDAARLDERPMFSAEKLLRQLGVEPGARILVCGSTHAGEEQILAGVFRSLKARFPDLFLVLVPRHSERGKEVGKDLKERGIKYIYRTELSADARFDRGAVECLLVNTTGELKSFYEQASVIFVGKSLAGDGGQNPIEPGALGKAMVFGPNMRNFTAIADQFVTRGGAVQVKDRHELEGTLDRLLRDEAARETLGRNALDVVRENQGSIEKTVEMIVRHLNFQEIYLAPKR